jgi:thiosulfate reductase cytochrome b subunit
VALDEQAGDGGEPRGITTLGGLEFDTTGLFGWSGGGDARAARAFRPGRPSQLPLAGRRARWHFFFAWLFVLNGLVYWPGG